MTAEERLARQLTAIARARTLALEKLPTDHGLIWCTRLRLDAQLFRPAPPRKSRAMGRPRLVGTRLPSLQQILTHRRTVGQRWKVGVPNR
jgi:hypothetical protein